MVANSKKKAPVYLDYEAGCPSSITVGDFVYVTGFLDGLLQTALVDITNLSTMPAFGIVIEKMAPTICKVRVSGEVITSINLIPGKRYFIDYAGRLTESMPSPIGGSKAAVQPVAYALDTNRLFLTLDQITLVRVN